MTIPAGAWGNRRDLSVLKRSLDADLDGQPEQIRYFDPKTGEMLRMEQDQDYDGDLDVWSNYEDGALVSREIDANGDGRLDVWERYAEGCLIWVEYE